MRETLNIRQAARRVVCKIIVMAVAATALGQERNQDSGDSVTESGRFKQTLKLTLTGDKVKASESWLIEPSGKWTVTTTSKENPQGTSRSGSLTEPKIAALAKDLEDFRLLDLPRDVATRTAIPAQLYTLSFGSYASTFELAAGKALPKSDPARTDPLSLAAHRFAAIVRGIQAQLKAP